MILFCLTTASVRHQDRCRGIRRIGIRAACAVFYWLQAIDSCLHRLHCLINFFLRRFWISQHFLDLKDRVLNSFDFLIYPSRSHKA